MRDTRRATPSATYRSPPGPTVLPKEPCRPDTSREALGSADAETVPAAGGMRIAITAASRNRNLRREPIMGPPKSQPLAVDTIAAMELLFPWLRIARVAMLGEVGGSHAVD